MMASTHGEYDDATLIRLFFRYNPDLVPRIIAGFVRDASEKDLEKIDVAGRFHIGRNYRDRLAEIHAKMTPERRTPAGAAEFLLGELGDKRLCRYVATAYGDGNGYKALKLGMDRGLWEGDD